ncbi:MAG: hypothetical protein BJ554DRAFT_1656 [Olpidium bornovanus]|uniref:Uncharacterized protein n=1 Tax=Olpidium bornovanus TaxID=278681 RepID=A0A8H7ZR91_9FUNG|nr:MAG: hypothetical protein BJ554DRAFT_1656 [Olpidium bornovanus]
MHVLVPAAGKANNDVLLRRHRRRDLHCTADGMRAFQGRNDSWTGANNAEGGKGIRTGVARQEAQRALDAVAASVVPSSCIRLRALRGGWRSEAYLSPSYRADAMRFLDLPLPVLEQIRFGPVQNPGPPLDERRRVPVRVSALPTGLDAKNSHTGQRDVLVEQADGIGAAAHARDHGVREVLSRRLAELGERFTANDGLKLAHQSRERVRSDGGANQIMRRAHIGHPIPHRLVNRVLQRLRACRQMRELPRTTVRELSDVTLHCGSHSPLLTETTVAPSMRIRNTFSAWRRTSSAPMYMTQSNPNFAQTVAVATPFRGPREQCITHLADCIVYFMTPRMVQIFPLQPDLCPSCMLRESIRELKLAWSAHKGVIGTKLLPEFGVRNRFRENFLKLSVGLHESLGEVLPPKLSEAPAWCGLGWRNLRGFLDLDVLGKLGFARCGFA